MSNLQFVCRSATPKANSYTEYFFHVLQDEQTVDGTLQLVSDNPNMVYEIGKTYSLELTAVEDAQPVGESSPACDAGISTVSAALPASPSAQDAEGLASGTVEAQSMPDQAQPV